MTRGFSRGNFCRQSTLCSVVHTRAATAQSPGATALSLSHSPDTGSNQLGPIYGHTSVTTGSLLDDHHWHSVVIERQGRGINLTLDRSTQHFRTNGEFDYLDLDYEVSLRPRPWGWMSGGCLGLLPVLESCCR